MTGLQTDEDIRRRGLERGRRGNYWSDSDRKKGEWKFSMWKAKACGFTISPGFCLDGMVGGLIDPLDG